MSTYVDAAGHRIRIGQELGRGGGGQVFVDPGDPASVIKLLKRATAKDANRLTAMVDLAVPASIPNSDAALAWPTRLIRDQPGLVCGYFMPAALGPAPQKLFKLMQRR